MNVSLAFSEEKAENLPGSFSILAFTVIAEMEHVMLGVWYRKAECSSTEELSIGTGLSNMYEKAPNTSDTVLTFRTPSVAKLRQKIEYGYTYIILLLHWWCFCITTCQFIGVPKHTWVHALQLALCGTYIHNTNIADAGK